MVEDSITKRYMRDRVLGENPDRWIEKILTSRWGRLVEPAPGEKQKRPSGGMRVMVIGSWTAGILLLKGLLHMEKEMPGKVQVVGLVTDDPHDPKAKISVKKRFWHYFTQKCRDDYEWEILHFALLEGIPCYTGEVKCEGFRDVLAKWNPDAIICAGFGQVIDEPIINYPAYGIYNMHPSDLLHHHGAGAQPWKDLYERHASTTRMTLHIMDTGVDTGDIVGQSPEINILTAEGNITDNHKAFLEKMVQPTKFMAQELARFLVSKYESGTTGAVDKIDFDSLASGERLKTFLAPVDPTDHEGLLPLPEVK